MNVKSDHCSKFSNFKSKWKEEAWKKNQGFNGIRTRDLRARGGTPYSGLYREAPPERGTFFWPQVYKRVGISQFKGYKRVGKSVI